MSLLGGPGHPGSLTTEYETTPTGPKSFATKSKHGERWRSGGVSDRSFFRPFKERRRAEATWPGRAALQVAVNGEHSSRTRLTRSRASTPSRVGAAATSRFESRA